MLFALHAAAVASRKQILSNTRVIDDYTSTGDKWTIARSRQQINLHVIIATIEWQKQK